MIIDQDPDTVPGGLIRTSGLVFAIMIVCSVGAVLLLGRAQLGEVMRPASAPPARLDTGIFDTETPAERARRLADERLQQYGWVDRARGLIHVPLDVAIELYLQQVAAQQVGAGSAAPPLVLPPPPGTLPSGASTRTLPQEGAGL